ncbi:MAG: hypothetical protein E4H02_03345 [Lentisphaerales bacterium]|jgi:hypothetical protein|nr:MAG: hypothetical protein E4H02_03345 [Lentisphaerales bacterium]
MTLDELKVREEQKRERHWNSRHRWEILQQTIAWASAQSTAPSHTPSARHAEEHRKLHQH